LKKESNSLELSADRVLEKKPTGEVAIELVRTLGSVLRDVLFMNERHLDVCPSNLSDITDYSSFLSSSVNEMMTSVARQGVSVLPLGPLQSGVPGVGGLNGVICIPFESSHQSKIKQKNTKNVKFKVNRNNGNLNTSMKSNNKNKPFARGYSLVFTDRNTPANHVTIITVAYHTSDLITNIYSLDNQYNRSNINPAIHLDPPSNNHPNMNNKQKPYRGENSSVPGSSFTGFRPFQVQTHDVDNVNLDIFPILLQSNERKELDNCEILKEQIEDGKGIQEDKGDDNISESHNEHSCIENKDGNINPIFPALSLENQSVQPIIQLKKDGIFGYILNKIDLCITDLFLGAKNDVLKQKQFRSP
jgi:hypothetical protein